MTRVIKQHQIFVDELTGCLARQGGSGYYHGEYFTQYNVRRLNDEINMMKEMRADIGLTQGQFRTAFGVITIEG